jgi:hypothetical protein
MNISLRSHGTALTPHYDRNSHLSVTATRESGSTMARISRTFVRTTVLAAACLSTTTLWAADEPTADATSEDVLVTEYRSRPPFERRFVSHEEIAALARFEETASEPAAAGDRVLDYRGRPPFKRQILSAEEAVELARFEETSSSDEADRRTRRGPPGKPASRR